MENFELEELKEKEITNLEIIPKTKHLCWLYESDEDRLGVVEPFLVAALSRRKRCLLVVPAAVRDEIYTDLTQGDVNVKRYQDTEQMLHVEPQEMFFQGGPLDTDVVVRNMLAALAKAQADGWAGLAIVIDTSLVLGQAKDEDWLALEFRMDYECYAKPCTMLCLYDQRLASGKLLTSMIKVHPVIGLGNTLARNPFYSTPTLHTS